MSSVTSCRNRGGGGVFNDNPMFDVIAVTIHTTTGVICHEGGGGWVGGGGGLLMPVIPAIDVSGLTFDEFLLRRFYRGVILFT